MKLFVCFVTFVANIRSVMAIPKKIGLEQQAVKISDLVRRDRGDARTIPPLTFGKGK